MVLVLLSRFSHLQINLVLISNLSEWCIMTLMLFGPISPENLWDTDIVNEIGWAVWEDLLAMENALVHLPLVMQ